MPLISVSDELNKKSFTDVENKFITKYMPELDANAVKVYLYSLYIYQSGLSSYSIEDIAQKLKFTEEELKGYYQYLEEFELVSILSSAPFEIKILDAENVDGKPKRIKPEKYADFSKTVQNIIKGRMISTNEFREYFYLLEEYGFDQDALLMIINYCVSLKGDAVRVQYIKKVAKNFADEGITAAAKVEERLSSYTSSTPELIAIFTAAGIKTMPDVEDNEKFKKWTRDMGFETKAVIAAAKLFKAKSSDKIDAALTELYRNKKFDVKEIEDYCKNKNSVYAAAYDIAKALGVYMQNPAPYVDSYVNVWYDYGYSFEAMRTLANYCFKHNKNSFEDLNELIKSLYDQGIVTDDGVNSELEKYDSRDRFIKSILTACGLSRKIIAVDRENLARWRSWNFSDDMLLEAAKLSAGKTNPISYMNGVLSSWKTQGIFSADKIAERAVSSAAAYDKAAIEQHYFDLRHSAEVAAENALKRATSDSVYGEIHAKLRKLSIDLAFAEVESPEKAATIGMQILQLEKEGDERLKALGIDKKSFTPQYSCKICNDTGYDKNGLPCQCLKRFLQSV